MRLPSFISWLALATGLAVAAAKAAPFATSGKPITSYAAFTAVLWIRIDQPFVGTVFQRLDWRGRGIAVAVGDDGPRVQLVGLRARMTLSTAERRPLTVADWHCLVVAADPDRSGGTRVWLDGRVVAQVDSTISGVATSQWITPGVDKCGAAVEVRSVVEVGCTHSATEIMLLSVAGPPPAPSPAQASHPESTGHGTALLEIRIWPQPARDVAHVSYTLSRACPVAMEIWDLQGRRRVRKEYGWRARGGGDLMVAPEVIRTLEPGTYIIRVTAGVHTSADRVVVLR